MQLEKGKISGLQLTFLMASLMMGSFQISGALVKTAKHDAWLTVFPALAEGLILVFIFATLIRLFPGKTLVEIHEAVYGPLAGKVLSLLYIWFFLHISSANFRYLGDYMTVVLPETPILIFIVSFVLLCASAVRNGIEVISRCSLLLVPVVTATVLISFALLFSEMEIKNLLPFFEISFPDLLKAQHITASIAYGELVVFTMVMAFVSSGKKIILHTFLPCFYFTFLIILIILRNTLTLGSLNLIMTRPSFEAIRLIDIAGFLTRMEILVVLNEVTMTFLKISVFYYAAVLGTAQILKMRSYLPLVLPMGALQAILSLVMYDFSTEYFVFAADIFPYYSIPFEVLLPTLTLMLGYLRFGSKPKRRKRKG